MSIHEPGRRPHQVSLSPVLTSRLQNREQEMLPTPNPGPWVSVRVADQDGGRARTAVSLPVNMLHLRGRPGFCTCPSHTAGLVCRFSYETMTVIVHVQKELFQCPDLANKKFAILNEF